jgi:hypothetical protein
VVDLVTELDEPAREVLVLLAVLARTRYAASGASMIDGLLLLAIRTVVFVGVTSNTSLSARRLTAAASLVGTGDALNEQPDGLLWRDRAAEDARAWFERRQVEHGAGAHLGLGKQERQYLEAVVALIERTRRRRRRLAAGAFALLSVIAVVVSLLAVRAILEGEEERSGRVLM